MKRCNFKGPGSAQVDWGTDQGEKKNEKGHRRKGSVKSWNPQSFVSGGMHPVEEKKKRSAEKDRGTRNLEKWKMEGNGDVREEHREKEILCRRKGARSGKTVKRGREESVRWEGLVGEKRFPSAEIGSI